MVVLVRVVSVVVAPTRAVVMVVAVKVSVAVVSVAVLDRVVAVVNVAVLDKVVAVEIVAVMVMVAVVAVVVPVMVAVVRVVVLVMVAVVTVVVLDMVALVWVVVLVMVAVVVVAVVVVTVAVDVVRVLVAVVLVSVTLTVVTVAVTILISGAVTVSDDSSTSRPCDWKLACRFAVKLDVSLAIWLVVSKICEAASIGATISKSTFHALADDRVSEGAASRDIKSWSSSKPYRAIKCPDTTSVTFCCVPELANDMELITT